MLVINRQLHDGSLKRPDHSIDAAFLSYMIKLVKYYSGSIDRMGCWSSIRGQGYNVAMKVNSFVWVPLIALSLVGCTKKADTAENGADVGADAAITALSGGVSATLDCLKSAVEDDCSLIPGQKNATSDACPIGRSGLRYSGKVKLAYSQTDCSAAVAGDTVTRTMDLTRTALIGVKVVAASDDHAHYNGTTHGPITWPNILPPSRSPKLSPLTAPLAAFLSRASSVSPTRTA